MNRRKSNAYMREAMVIIRVAVAIHMYMDEWNPVIVHCAQKRATTLCIWKIREENVSRVACHSHGERRMHALFKMNIREFVQTEIPFRLLLCDPYTVCVAAEMEFAVLFVDLIHISPVTLLMRYIYSLGMRNGGHMRRPNKGPKPTANSSNNTQPIKAEH